MNNDSKNSDKENIMFAQEKNAKSFKRLKWSTKVSASVANTTAVLFTLGMLASSPIYAANSDENANENAETSQIIRLSEPVIKDDNSETFGEVIDGSLPSVKLASLSEEPSLHLDKDFIVETKIARVCQKKGCFFIAQDGDTIIRVSFKDYGFFIPTDTAGRTVTLAGRLIEKQMSEKQAAHFQSDLGNRNANSAAANQGDKIAQAIKPGKVYEIVASGVRIPTT
jgi:hypothetical protein